MKSGRPRGPGEAFKNDWGEAPHISEGFPGPPWPARPQNRPNKIRPDCLQVKSRIFLGIAYTSIFVGRWPTAVLLPDPGHDRLRTAQSSERRGACDHIELAATTLTIALFGN